MLFGEDLDVVGFYEDLMCDGFLRVEEFVYVGVLGLLICEQIVVEDGVLQKDKVGLEVV